MPRTLAPRPAKRWSARKTFAVAAVIAAACLFALGLSPISLQVVRSQEAAGARSLSTGERVVHQRAVEEVYWRHTLWPKENSSAKPSLDEVAPMEQTTARVEDTLRKSEALARRWGRPVSAEQLQAEVERMARETKRPEVLRELWQALGNDPFVIAEVLARPALVDRLARASFDAEENAAPKGAPESGATQASFDAWWGSESRQYAADAQADGGYNYRLAEVNSAAADDTWSPMQALPVSTGSAAVWTGAEVIIWGGTTQYGGRTNAGSRYNPATDTWTPTGTVGAPRARSGNAAYWTGTEMLIWGGLVGVNCGGDGPCRYDYTNTGGRYNPQTDTWTPTSTSGAPATSNALTVWTGSKMIVLGSLSSYVYDPASDTWTLTPRSSLPGFVGNRAVWTGTEIFTWGGINNDTGMRGGLFNPETGTWRHPNNFNAPSERNNFSMIWTGTEVVVWGGFEGNNVTLNTGGRYNPQTDTWTPTSTVGAPAPRYGHVAVWTGSEMVVHGGDLRPAGQMALTNTGARYNPASDSWAAISTAGSPVKFQHVGVWTGTEVFVWGGSTGTGSLMKEGARFNPSNDTWTPVNNNDSPLYLDRGVWTGAEMLVWGENSLCNCFTSVGGRYDPATNVWRPMSLAGAPVAGTKGYGTSALWTGKEMLVWGGGRGRYNPQTDSWAAISATNAPAEGFSAVWSGKEMIVWGSSSTQGGADTGGRYNPETDTWRPTSTAGAPAGRYMHTAVWSGSEMIVWGGTTAGVAGKHNTGGRYNPETDTWRPTSTAGAPEGRTYHTAVWTGSAMVVWGGSKDGVSGNASLLNTGGRYDPAADAWTPTATAGAPEARSDHRAVWTGSQMIVWGGAVEGVTGPSGTYTGARYNPQIDVWTTTSTLRAPSKRVQHVQVWTGSQMIVWGGMASEGAATHGAVYNAPGASAAGNLPPTVSLSSPAGGSGYQSGDTVQFAAEVSDPDGAVKTVRFYANGQLVGADTQAPFAFAWGEARGGSYALTAVATDDGNAEARSAEVNISVAPSAAPPACVLTAPADGTTYAHGASVRMEATMTPNRDRSIARVEFLVDGQMATYYEPPTYNPPYVHTYTANVAGARSLAARCTDNMGGVTTSTPKVINVEEQGFSVSGQLLESGNGAPVANIRLRLDGPAGTAPQYMTTTVGGMGNYYFGGLKPGQNYTITLEAPAWRWAPDGATFTAISRSYTQQHFYGTRVGLAITGRLTDAAGNPVYPASVYLSGSKNAYTNVLSDGTYFFYGLAPGGTYTVQPYKNLHAFEPGHRTFANLSADQVADFRGTMQGQTFTVGGRIVNEGGIGLAGMVVKLSASNQRTTTTGADGRYSFAGVASGESLGVYPSDPSNTYRFTPVSQFKANLAQDYVVPDFVAVPITYVISGVVKDGAGQAVPGVTVTLGGAASGTTTTGTEGNYIFRDLPVGGDYTATASKSGYAFTPNEHAIKGLNGDVATAHFAATPSAESVTWASVVGATASGGSLTRGSAPAGWTAGASSTKALASGDGYVEFTAAETNTNRMAGLSRGDSNQGYADIDYAVYLYSDGSVYVFEGGVNRGAFGRYAAGDRFRVAVEGGVVKYRKNGALLYTSTAAPQYPLSVDASLSLPGATVSSAALSGTLVNVSQGEGVVWANVTGVNATGNSLRKSATSYAWDAGAVSSKSLPAGDGQVEFTAAETNTNRMAGLSHGDSDQGYADIDYAVYLYSDGTAYVFEKGVNRGKLAAYTSGDRFRVSVEGGTVKYWKNGALLYTSSVAPQYPLLVDTALSLPGATLNNVVISGNWVENLPANPVEAVTWANLSGVAAAGGSLTRGTAVAGWTAGASSTRALASGDGHVEFTATEVNRNRMAGLSHGDSDQGYADIDYAVYLYSDGTTYIFEKGVNRGAFGRYASGDRFRVAVEGGVVKYRKNGALLYTSAVAPQYPLLVDTSLSMAGATVTDAALSGSLTP